MKAKSHKRRDRPDTSEEVAQLRELLADAQATLRAIRNGEVDAIVVDGELGPQVYTLQGAEFDYRVLIESMNEGALVLTPSAQITYANTNFALMLERPLAQVIGRSLYELVSATDQPTLARLLKRAATIGATTEVLLQRSFGTPMPAKVSIRLLPDDDARNVSFGAVVSDLTEPRDREALLRSFSHALMQVQETERTQVATELGENISQLLSCTLIRCQALAGGLPASASGFREEVIEFAQLLRTTAEEVNRISADLRPHGLEILGLASALRGVVAEFAERMGLSIKVNFAKMTTRLPARAELALYRVLQEALRNVEQHAKARHVTVTLARRGAVVQLAIRDDGVGFDASAQQGHGMQAGRFGLLSMRERARAVSGSLNVKSTTSGGTEIRLNVPVISEESASTLLK